MPTLQESARAFLSQERIAVAGVSRDPKQTANLIARKLAASGSQVFAVNPRASEIEGKPSYPDLRSIPGGVQALLIVTPPEAALPLVRECAEVGVRHVWMHRGFGAGSLSKDAVDFCRQHEIEVIPGACPLMYIDHADFPHRCMRTLMGWFGKLPHV
ncbi:MAG: CoA-binding protein [Candidatus Eisenbacteria bacterium]|nr:CoA-binding protein [Candidatus Eisenbacteria bacterium]